MVGLFRPRVFFFGCICTAYLYVCICMYLCAFRLQSLYISGVSVSSQLSLSLSSPAPPLLPTPALPLGRVEVATPHHDAFLHLDLIAF